MTATISDTTPAAGTDTSAQTILGGLLGSFGLQSLADWAWTKWQAGESLDQIMVELRTTPEYKTRFPAMDALSAKGRAITEAQYINYEQTATSLYRAAGLPESFYDQPSDFAALIGGEVGLPELKSRLDMAQSAAFTAPTETRQALQDLYGISGGDLTAYWLDPTRALPFLQQRAQAAMISGAGIRTGYGELTAAQSENLASLGVTDTQAQQGLSQLAASAQLFNPLAGQENSYQGVTRDQQLGAAFGGDSNAAEIIRREQQRRLNEFQGQTQFASSQAGPSGVGTAR